MRNNNFPFQLRFQLKRKNELLHWLNVKLNRFYDFIRIFESCLHET